MDTTKLRLAAGAGAAIFGVVGLSILSIAIALALQPQLGLVVSLGVVGGALFLIAVTMMFILARPDQSTEEEMEKVEELAAETLADLPFDTVKAIIEKRPMASLAIAATTGYAMSKDPERAIRNLRRVVTGLL